MSSTTAQVDQLGTRKRVAAVIAGSAGNLIEWYDFYVYAFTSIYFAAAFFPAGDRTAQLLNVAGMRQAILRLQVLPSYVLTDGFPVPGLPMPTLAVWKGDRIAACVAAASVVAKVTRDRLMVTMHDDYPVYEFAAHKGYVTPEHQDALRRHGPCLEHRFSYINVARAGASHIGLAEATSMDEAASMDDLPVWETA